MTTPERPSGTGSADGTKPQRADAQRNRASILAAAEAVFAEKGPSASTGEVAARAGVAIGTVFRHFPTKQTLLQAIMKDLLLRLAQEADSLNANESPATALFTFITRIVEQAADKKTIVDLLAQTGINLQVADSVPALRAGIAQLLTRAQRVGAVHEEVRLDEVIALLTSACHGALHAGWDHDLRQRTLTIMFNGLRCPPGPHQDRPM